MTTETGETAIENALRIDGADEGVGVVCEGNGLLMAYGTV